MNNTACTTTAASIILLWVGVGAGLIMSCEDQAPPPKKKRVTFQQDEIVRLGLRIKGNISIPDKCMKGYELKKFLSAGSYGSVYHACDPEANCMYVMKFQEANATFFKELEIARKLSKLNVGPKLIGGWKCEARNVGIMVTEKWDGSMEERDFDNIPTRLLTKLRKQIKIMHDNNLIHSDINHRNILVKRDKSGKLTDITLNDFGITKYLNEMVPDANESDDKIWEKLEWADRLYAYHLETPHHFEYFDFLDPSFQEIVDNPQHLDKAFLHYLTLNNKKSKGKKAKSKKSKSLNVTSKPKASKKNKTV